MIDTLPVTIISRLIEESPDAVLVIDEHGTIRYMNGAMHALCGFAPGEALGQSLLGLLPENMGQHHQGYIQRFMEHSSPSTVLGAVREFAVRHRTGEMIPIEMKALDLGMMESVRYFGAFMGDLRPRRQAEARNASLLAQLEHQAMSDSLTGLPNRRAFELEAARMKARARRSAAPITVAIADIDFFKQVNDASGHQVGDQVLCEVSAVLSQSARATDFVARIGGEEFGFMFPDATPDTARAVAERMRSAVMNAVVKTSAGAELRITISIGLALFEDSLSEALSNADRAMYLAKHNGRNRVELA